MNTNMKAIVLAAVMMIAAVAAVSISYDDTDAATDITIVNTPYYTEETHPLFGDIITLNIEFSAAPSTCTVDVYENGELVISNAPTAANGSLTVLGVSDTVVRDISALRIVAHINGGDIQWPAETPGADTYTVTVEQPVNGNITITGADELTAVPAGTEITISVEYDSEQYQLDAVTANGQTITAVDGVYTYTVNADVVISAQISEIGEPGVEYTVTVDAGENGQASADPVSGVAGTQVTVTIIPAQGYEIDTITVNGTAVTVENNVYTFELTQDTVVAVTFKAVADRPGDENDADRPFPNVITLGDGAVIDADSYINASASQEVVIAGDVTIIAGGYMNIDGKLTIQEGASLTIENGGWVTIGARGVVDVQGDLVAEAGTAAQPTFAYGGILMTVAGTVTLEGAQSFTSSGTGIEISGTFEVGDEASAQFNDATIAEGGELIVFGVVTGTVTNDGTVTIDSQGFEGGVTTVNMTINMEPDAVVDVINVYGTVSITDAKLEFDATRAITDVPAKYDNTVTLTNVAGVTVTETLVITQDKDDKNVYIGTNTMYVSGNMTYAIDYSAENTTGDVAVAGGKVEMSTDSVLTEGVSMAVNGSLTVSANLDATAEAGQITVNAGGELTVTGKINTYGNATNGGISGAGAVNAARYTVSTTNPATTVYTTLETALNDAATDITLLGKNTVEADATIPVGTTVTMNDGSTLKVAEGATLTVAADDRRSARLTTGNTVDTVTIDGTLVVEDMAKSRVVESAILSDTSKEVDDTMTFTNVYSALEAAADGEVVEITRSNSNAVIPVELDADVTVGAGVTLWIPAGQQVTVLNDVTVTVDGTVYAQGAYVLTDEVPEDDSTTEIEYKAAGATVVNGMFLYTNGNDYTGAVEHSGQIVGAYFEYSYTFQNNRAATVDAIAPLASVPAIADDVMSENVTLYGNQALGSIDFSAYDGEEALAGIVVAANVTIEDITLGNLSMTTQGEVSVTGTVTLANGAVELDNVYGFQLRNDVDDIEETTTSVVAGSIHAYDNPETENVVETGSVSFSGEVTSMVDVFGDSVVAEDAKQCVSMTVPAGATVSFQTGVYYAPVSIEGEAVITGANVLFHDLTVTGTVSSYERNIAQAVTMYVGVTEDDMAMAGTGDVTGVRLASGTGSVAYVSPNATVGEEITEDSLTTAYYVEDELYVTAYANSPNYVDVNIDFTVENAYFMGWQYENSQGRIVDVPITGAYVGGDYDEVYASIDYEIYDVMITADAGIGTVAIDGVVLPNNGGNVFVAYGLTAGQHTVSYTLRSGYQGEAVLSVSGENASVSGLNFTLSGNPAEDTTDLDHQVDVVLSLSGTSPADQTIVIDNGGNGDSGMGLTDYLLIILVILIIVMAIIVALRLMRS